MEDNNDSVYEPMEIDLSDNSIKNINNVSSLTIKKEKIISDNGPASSKSDFKMANNDVDSIGKQKVNVKKFHLVKPVKNNNNSLRGLSVIFVILISVLLHKVKNFECKEEWDINSLRQKLSNNIYGQDQALDALSKALEMNASKLIFLYGGTGVGKTYTASLILENMHNYSNIYHYTMPSFETTFSPELMLGFIFCKSTTIIVDDLARKDMQINKLIKDIFAKGDNLKKNITIVLIYNCDGINNEYTKRCDDTFYTELKNIFTDVNATKHFIKYESLKEQHLQECIKRELGNLRIAKSKMRDFMKNFDVSLDGCKNVHTKVKMLNIF